MIYLMKSVLDRIRNLAKDEPISEAARSLASLERHRDVVHLLSLLVLNVYLVIVRELLDKIF